MLLKSCLCYRDTIWLLLIFLVWHYLIYCDLKSFYVYSFYLSCYYIVLYKMILVIMYRLYLRWYYFNGFVRIFVNLIGCFLFYQVPFVLEWMLTVLFAYCIPCYEMFFSIQRFSDLSVLCLACRSFVYFVFMPLNFVILDYLTNYQVLFMVWVCECYYIVCLVATYSFVLLYLLHYHNILYFVAKCSYLIRVLLSYSNICYHYLLY